MNRAKQAAVTRMLYDWEEAMGSLPLRPIAQLRALGRRIWKQHARGRGVCPVIVAGRGVEQAGRLLSYCEGRRIVLTRNQRERRTLIHEMVHALGPGTHGRRFQELYAELLAKYL